MRRNWKRILSLLLTVAMVFTMNTSVFADTYKVTDGENVTYVNADKTAAPDGYTPTNEEKEYSEALEDVKAKVKQAKSDKGLEGDEETIWKTFANNEDNAEEVKKILATEDPEPETVTATYEVEYVEGEETKTALYDADGNSTVEGKTLVKGESTKTVKYQKDGSYYNASKAAIEGISDSAKTAFAALGIAELPAEVSKTKIFEYNGQYYTAEGAAVELNDENKDQYEFPNEKADTLSHKTLVYVTGDTSTYYEVTKDEDDNITNVVTYTADEVTDLEKALATDVKETPVVTVVKEEEAAAQIMADNSVLPVWSVVINNKEVTVSLNHTNNELAWFEVPEAGSNYANQYVLHVKDAGENVTLSANKSGSIDTLVIADNATGKYTVSGNIGSKGTPYKIITAGTSATIEAADSSLLAVYDSANKQFKLAPGTKKAGDTYYVAYADKYDMASVAATSISANYDGSNTDVFVTLANNLIGAFRTSNGSKAFTDVEASAGKKLQLDNWSFTDPMTDAKTYTIVRGSDTTAERLQYVTVSGFPVLTGTTVIKGIETGSDGSTIKITPPNVKAGHTYEVAISTNTAFGLTPIEYTRNDTNEKTKIKYGPVSTASDGVYTITGYKGNNTNYDIYTREISANNADYIYIPSAWEHGTAVSGVIDADAVKSEFGNAVFTAIGTKSVKVNFQNAENNYTVSELAIVRSTQTTAPSSGVSRNALNKLGWGSAITDPALISSNIAPGYKYAVWAKVYNTGDTYLAQGAAWVKFDETFITPYSYQVVFDYKKDDDGEYVDNYNVIGMHSGVALKNKFTGPYLRIVPGSGYGSAKSDIAESDYTREASATGQTEYINGDTQKYLYQGVPNLFAQNVISANGAYLTNAKNNYQMDNTIWNIGKINTNPKAFVNQKVTVIVSYNGSAASYDKDTSFTASKQLTVAKSKITVSANDSIVKAENHIPDVTDIHVSIDTRDIGDTEDTIPNDQFIDRTLDKEASMAGFTAAGGTLSKKAYTPGSYTIALNNLSTVSADIAGQLSWFKTAWTKTDEYEFVTDKTAKDFIVAPSGKDVLSLTITPGKVMYGEKSVDGAKLASNAALDSLNNLFNPVLSVSGNAQDESGYTLEYKFVDKAELVDARYISNNSTYIGLTTASFNGLTAKKLETFNAGDTVYYAVRATAGTNNYVYATGSFVMEKRDVRVSYNGSYTGKLKRNNAVDTLSVNGSDAEYANFNQVEIYDYTDSDAGTLTADNFGAEVPSTRGAIVSDNTAVYIDVAPIDWTKTDVQSSTFEFTPVESFDKNFNVKNTLIKIELGAYYTATFMISGGGSVSSNTFEINQTGDRKVSSLTNGTFNGEVAIATATYDVSWNGLIDKDVYSVTGFEVYKNNSRVWYTNGADGINTDSILEFANYKAYVMAAGSDYRFVAVVKAKANTVVSVTTVGDVVYDPRGFAHELMAAMPDGAMPSVYGTWSYGSKTYDINLNLNGTVYSDNGEKWDVDGKNLTINKDYKVSYKNNKEANVYYTADGSLAVRKGFEKKKPTIIITGLGDYKGLKMTLYFNILPYNIGNIGATVTGLKSGFVANKNGKDIKLSYKVTNVETLPSSKTKTYTLKKNKDFIETVYKFDNDGKYWAKSTPAAAGDYQLRLVGTGNYTGTLSNAVQIGADGDFDPTLYLYFHIVAAGDKSKLMNNARITLVKNMKWTGSTVKVEDLVTKVVLAKKTLTKNTDYTVEAYAKADTDYTTALTKIKDAGEYVIVINPTAKSKLYGTGQKAYKIIGQKLKAGNFYFTVQAGGSGTIKNGGKVDYDGQNMTLKLDNKGGYTYSKDYTYDPAYTLAFVNGDNIEPNVYTVKLIGAGQYAGSTVDVKFTRKAMSIKKAVELGYIKFTPATSTPQNAAGAFPKLDVAIKGTSTGIDYRTNLSKSEITKSKIENVYFFDAGNTRSVIFDITVANNKKTGTGKITLKADNKANPNNIVTGSYTIPFTIEATKITTANLLNYYSLYKNGDYTAPTKGKFYLAVDDSLAKNGNAKAPTAKLYQASDVEDDNGAPVLAEVKKSDYKLVAATSGVAGNKVELAPSTSKKPNYTITQFNTGITYNAYANKAKFPNYKSGLITTLSFNGTGTNGNGITSGKLISLLNANGAAQAEYTGGHILPEVKEITVSYGKGLTKKLTAEKNEFSVYYGDNTSVGNGTFTVKIEKAGAQATNYEVGGTYTYKFKIVGQKAVVIAL